MALLAVIVGSIVVEQFAGALSSRVRLVIVFSVMTPILLGMTASMVFFMVVAIRAGIRRLKAEEQDAANG